MSCPDKRAHVAPFQAIGAVGLSCYDVRQPGAAHVKSYRVYCFDGASRITAAESIQATTDEEAMDAGRKLFECFRIEVWDRDRLVGRHQRGAP